MINLRFDLTAMRSLPDARMNDVGRWASFGGVGVFAAIAIWFVSTSLRSHPGISPPLGFYGLLAAFAFFIGMLTLRVHMCSPSADWVALDERAVALGYRNGRVRRIDWADPEFYFAMSRTEPWRGKGKNHPLTIRAGSLYQHYAFPTQPAFDEIIRASQTHGMRVVGGIRGRYGAVTTVITRA
jgi:hypothetical protein